MTDENREEGAQEQKQKLSRMQSLVQESLDRGRLPAAKAALSRGWRESVPDLPLRFSVLLLRPREDDVAAVLRRLRANGGRKPPLRLSRGKDGSIRVCTRRGKKLVLGELPRGEVKLLRDLGRDANLYQPELLEIRHDDHGRVRSVAIELIRPGDKHEDSLPQQIHEAIEAVMAEDVDGELDF
jgi:hypothetical protein